MFHVAPLKGIYSAQWLPVDNQGDLDVESMRVLIEFQREAGIHGILTLGSTGYFPMFTPKQRENVLEQTMNLAGALPIIANISDICEENVIRLGQSAREMGIRVVALMPPMFYPLSQADLLAYFLQVAERVDLPLVLYNFPERTGIKIEQQTIIGFAQRARLAGVKQSGADFCYHYTLVKLGAEYDFSVLTGSDTELPAVAQLGGHGCVGGLCNIVPELMVRAYEECWQDEESDPNDTTASQKLREVADILSHLEFPLNVAAGIEARGWNPGAFRRTVSAESECNYAQIVSGLRTLLAKWKLPLAETII